MSEDPYKGPGRTLVLAFDVGTTYSGISFCVLDPGTVPKIVSVTRCVSILLTTAAVLFKPANFLFIDILDRSTSLAHPRSQASSTMIRRETSRLLVQKRSWTKS